MKTSFKNFQRTIALLAALFSTTAYGQIIGTNCYLIGDYLEIGVNGLGHEGAASQAWSNNRSNQAITSPVYFGFVANPQMDGWVNYDGDFFTPGSPENGFGFEVAGINYHNNCNFNASTNPGSITGYNVDGDCITAFWEGTNAAGLDIEIIYKLITTEIYYTTTVMITNTTGATMTDVYYYRNFDPDNNVTIGGGYSTQNTIVDQWDASCPRSLVTATQTGPWASYVGMGGVDPDFRVTYGGFINRDASNIWNGVGFTDVEGSTAFADQAISLAHRTYTLLPGQTDTFSFAIVQSAAELDAAFSGLYYFNYAGSGGSAGDVCNPVTDTVLTCAGDPITISVDGPGAGSYSWAWTPPAGLSTTIGPTTDAGPVVTTTYTVTGTPTVGCLSTPIVKDIVVDITPAPDVVVTDPGPQCMTFDLNTLVVTDLNAIVGALTSWYSVPPDSSDQTVGLLPDMTMEPGDIVYVMMYDPISGCFDFEPVIITFDSLVNAGLDYAESNCSGAGVLDVGAMLSGADPGGTWSEVTAGGTLDGVAETFDITALAPGVYVLEYTVLGGSCPDDVATITLTVETEVTAGLDNATTVCNDAGSTVDMNTLLSGADAGGFFTETSASGAFTAGTGVLDADGLAGGVYTFTYTVPAVAPCLTDVADFTVTVNNQPDAGLDNSTTICNTAGSTVDVNTLLSGADAGGTWAETSASGAFNPATGILTTGGLAAGAYTFTYSLTGIAPCIPDVADFTVTVMQEANAGLDNGTSICNSAGSSVDVNTLLSGADAGGAWAETSASGSFNPATGILTTGGLAAGVYTFTYTVTPVAPCVPDVADFTVTVEQEANAGADNTADVCNGAGSSVDCNTLLSGADPGGTWAETSASGAFTAGTGILNADGLAPGVYTFTYTVAGVAPCVPDVADFTITVQQEVDAGLDNISADCNTLGASIDMNTLLIGADPGGAWAETSASGAFNPATGIFTTDGLTAGVYTFTYTMTAIAPCLNDVADFTITVEQEVTAGLDNTTTDCNDAGASVDINTLLSGADAGGAFAETSASGAFTPGTGILTTDGLAAGVYTFTYTVTGVAPCPNDVSDFTVTVEQFADAGADNSSTICNTAGSTIDMNTLLVGAMAGGSWTETSASGQFTPATGIFDGSGLAAGDYTFTYTVGANAPCVPDVADFTITVTNLPNAGLDNTDQICNLSGSTVDLNTLLSGADAGGTWAETTASGSFDPASGIFTTDGVPAGVYSFTYTLAAAGPCPGDVANFDVTVEQEVTAGADDITAICNVAGSTVDINTLLSGADPGGAFAETSASGAFTPGTGVLNTAGLGAGVYTFTYTVTGIAPCPSDVADFTVTVEQEVDAGLDNLSAQCNVAGSTVDINTLLSGADPGGAFAETSASGSFTPGTGILDTDGLTAGVYTFTYTVTGIAPCPSDVADFTVTVEQEVDAGLDNATAICNTLGSTVDINTLLSGADAGGTFAETSGSGAFTAGTGILDTDGLGAGAYTFTYTMTGVAPCPTDVSNFTITVEQEAIAGPDNSATMCNTAGSTMDLNTLLSGAAAGTWVETTASGQFTAGTGVFDASGLIAAIYTFTYTVTGIAPCVDDVADISITVTNLPNAGLDNVAQICNVAGSTVDLNTLLSGADPGGTWTETTGSGSFDPGTGIFDTDGVPAGVYTFTYDLAPVGPCPGDQAVFNVTVEQEVVAGTDDFTPEICNVAGSTVDLNTSLSGASAGGTWTETSGSGAFTAGTGILDTDGLPAGVYTFTYEVFGVAPCPNDLADFTVTVQEEVNAGLDGLIAQCNFTGSTVDMATLLSGADAGGSWTETTSSGSFAGGIFDISDLPGGVYTFTYTVTGISPCPSDVSTFNVTVNEVPVLDPLSDEELCDADNLVSQNFTSTTGGTMFDWTNISGIDIGFGTSGTGGSIGSFTGNTGSTTDETVTIEVTPYTADCIGSPLTFDITVHPLPQVLFTPNNTIGCEPLHVTFNNSFPGVPGAICNWTFGDGTNSGTCDVVSHEYTNAGIYDVGLTVTTIYGCTNSVMYTDLIEVYPQANAEFTYSPTDLTVADTRVDFDNYSTDASGYTWTFGDGSTSNETDPSHTYPEVGNVTYTVTLTAHSPGGCDDEISKIISIDDVIIFYVPNVFTPDGDEYNENFKPIITAGVDVYDYHLTIFNRWGEIVFESYNKDFGWDGTYGNEGLVQDGVYVWQMEFGETMSDKKHKHRGHVTILK